MWSFNEFLLDFFLLSCLILSRWIINGNGYFTLSSYLTKQINYGNTSLCWAFFIKHPPSFPSTSTLSSVKCACGISPVTRQWTRQFEFVCLKTVRNSKLIFYRTQVYLGSGLWVSASQGTHSLTIRNVLANYAQVEYKPGAWQFEDNQEILKKYPWVPLEAFSFHTTGPQPDRDHLNKWQSNQQQQTMRC